MIRRIQYTDERLGRLKVIPDFLPSPDELASREEEDPSHRQTDGRIPGMSIDEIEAEALKLDPRARARLAERLLNSLEALSDEENERLWVEEAEKRDADWDATQEPGRPATDVLRDARAKLK